MASRTTKKETINQEKIVKVEEKTTEVVEEKKQESKKESCKTYTTKVANEDLCKICAEVGGTVTATIKANSFENYNKIPAGTKIVIK